MALHPVAAAHETLIRGFIKKGLSSRGIMRSLRGQGLSFRTTDMLASLRTFRGIWKFQEQIERLIPERMIPRAFLIEQKMGRGAAYRYFGEATFQMKSTGEIITRPVSWYSNLADIKREVTDEWVADFQFDSTNPDEDLLGVELKQVYHDPDFPY